MMLDSRFTLEELQTFLSLKKKKRDQPSNSSVLSELHWDQDRENVSSAAGFTKKKKKKD